MQEVLLPDIGDDADSPKAPDNPWAELFDRPTNSQLGSQAGGYVVQPEASATATASDSRRDTQLSRSLFSTSLCALLLPCVPISALDVLEYILFAVLFAAC